MKLIGKDGEITKFDYMHWAIFREFRKTNQFLEAYENIFGVKFVKEEEIEASDDNLPSKIRDLIKTTQCSIGKSEFHNTLVELTAYILPFMELLLF